MGYDKYDDPVTTIIISGLIVTVVIFFAGFFIGVSHGYGTGIRAVAVNECGPFYHYEGPDITCLKPITEPTGE